MFNMKKRYQYISSLFFILILLFSYLYFRGVVYDSLYNYVDNTFNIQRTGDFISNEDGFSLSSNFNIPILQGEEFFNAGFVALNGYQDSQELEFEVMENFSFMGEGDSDLPIISFENFNYTIEGLSSQLIPFEITIPKNAKLGHYKSVIRFFYPGERMMDSGLIAKYAIALNVNLFVLEDTSSFYYLDIYHDFDKFMFDNFIRKNLVYVFGALSVIILLIYFLLKKYK